MSTIQVPFQKLGDSESVALRPEYRHQASRGKPRDAMGRNPHVTTALGEASWDHEGACSPGPGRVLLLAGLTPAVLLDERSSGPVYPV